MRLLIPILASPLFLICSCSEPAAKADSQTASQGSNQTLWRVQNVDPATAQKLLTESRNNFV